MPGAARVDGKNLVAEFGVSSWPLWRSARRSLAGFLDAAHRSDIHSTHNRARSSPSPPQRRPPRRALSERRRGLQPACPSQEQRRMEACREGKATAAPFCMRFAPGISGPGTGDLAEPNSHSRRRHRKAQRAVLARGMKPLTRGRKQVGPCRADQEVKQRLRKLRNSSCRAREFRGHVPVRKR